MSKLSNKELMAYAGVGYVPPEGRVSAISVPNTELDNQLQSLRYVDKRSRLAQLMPGVFGEEEETAGVDVGEETLIEKDPQGKDRYFKYMVKRDLKTGQIIDKRLADDIEGVLINDVTEGKVENPLYRQVKQQELYKRIYSDIDPATDEFKTDVSKAWMQEVFDNSIWGAFDQLAGGEVSRQLSNGAIENLEIKNNDIYYGGAKVNIPSNLAEDFNEWLNKKSTYQADGFADQLATTASSFLIDAPFFYAGGSIGGKIVEGIAPGLAASTTLPGRLTKHIAQNLAMLSIIDTPRMINHTIEGGTNALLEDIKGIGEFAVLAGSFGTIGDYLGMGVSKLLQKPKALQLNQAAQFLRKNPQITMTLTGGLTSGMLGYTTGGETYEEKLATAFTFAAMHFSSPNAWKAYAKGDKKAIMVDDTRGQIRAIQTLVEKGMSLEEATKQAGAIIPDYYFREGNKLTKINKDVFITKGEIELVPETQFPSIELTSESGRNYKYITEAVPFAKITMREALKRGKIQVIANEIRKEMPVNPYDQKTQSEQYDSYEYGKQVLSNNVASTIYANKLNSIFKSRQLPDEPTLNKMIVKLSDNWKLPVNEVRNQIYPHILEYLENPSALQRDLYVEQGGETLPTVVFKYNKELADAVNKSIEIITKSQQQKLLKPADYTAEGVIIPSTEGRTYYDLNGELIPLDVYIEGKAKIGDIEFKPDKKNIVTEQQLKEQQRAQQTENNYVATKVKEYYDEQISKGVKPTPDELLKIGKEARKQYGKEQVGQPENKQTSGGGISTETGSSNRPSDVEGKEQSSGKIDEEAQIIKVGDTFKWETEEGEQRTYRVKKESSVPGEENKWVVEFKNKQGEWQLFGGGKFSSEQIAKAKSKEKPSQIENNALEAQDKANVEKPIVTSTQPEIESPKRSKEEIFSQFKDDSLQKAAEGLTTVYEPKTTSFRDESGKIKPEVTQRLIDLEEKAAKSAEKLSTETGIKVSKEDVLITALKPYYTSAEIGTIFALRNIHSNDAIKNRDFVNNRLKKLGLDLGSKAGQISDIKQQETGKKNIQQNAELTQANLSIMNLKPSEKPGEPERAEKERRVIQQSIEVQDKITNLLKERNLPEITEERKNEINTELQDLYKQKQELGKRQAELSSDEILYETQNNIIQKVGANLEERFKIEDEFKNIFGDNIQVTWGHPPESIGKGKKITARTYLDANNKLHIDFSTLASTETALHEKLHGQMLMAADGNMVEKILHEANPDYDGMPGSENWRKAHEQVIKDAMASRKDQYGFTDKLREVWQKLQNFFTGKGWYSSAEFYRKLLNNEIKMGEGKPSKPLYELRDKDKYEEALRQANKYAKEQIFKDLVDEPINDSREATDKSLLQQRYAVDLANTMAKPHTFLGLVKESKIFRKPLNTVKKLWFEGSLGTVNVAARFPEIEEVKKHIDYFIRKTQQEKNRVWNDKDNGMNGGKFFREKVSEQQKESYLSALEDYSNKRSDGEIPENLTANQFMDKYKFDEQQRDLYRRMKWTYDQYWKIGKDGAKQIFKEFRTTDFLSEGLSVKKIEELLNNYPEINKAIEIYKTDKNKKLLNDTVSQFLKTNEQALDKVAEYYADKIYPTYDDEVYFSSTRDDNPNNYVIRMYKILKPENVINKNNSYEQIKSGEQIIGYRDVIDARAENEKQATEIRDKWFTKGYALESDGFYKISDVVSKNEFSKLTARQLVNLVNEGHLALNNPTVRQLLETIKSGKLEQHTIFKRYIKGADFTPKGFEKTLDSFGYQAVNSNYKQIGLLRAKKALSDIEAKFEIGLKEAGLPEGEKDELRMQLNYIHKLVNAATFSDKSKIDDFRKVVNTWFLGLKPSILPQQASQMFSGTYALAHQEGKAGEIENKAALLQGMKLAQMEWEIKKANTQAEVDEIVKKYGLSKEYYDAYRALYDGGRLSKVMVSEMMQNVSDIEYNYSEGMTKGLNTAYRYANTPMSLIENYSRLHAFDLFYRIGEKKGLTGEKLISYINNNISKALADYSPSGRPVLFQSKIVGVKPNEWIKALDKIYFTFKNWSAHNTGLYYEFIRNKNYAAISTKALIGLGLHGLPGFAFVPTLFAVMNLFTEDDVEHEALRALADLDDKLGGLPIGTILGRGVHPILGMEARQLYGEESVFPTDIYAKIRGKKPVTDKLTEVMLGAPWGLTQDFINSADAGYKLLKNNIFNEQDLTSAEKSNAWKNLSKLSPVFVRNVLSAMTLVNDGIELRGKTIVKSDDLDWVDVGYKILGFQPKKISDSYEEQFYGTTAKLSRANGRITELKKIRKEITISKDYSSEERRTELIKIAQMIRESQKEEAILTKQLNLEKHQLLTK